MKVKTERAALLPFRPVTLTVVLETREELDALTTTLGGTIYGPTANEIYSLLRHAQITDDCSIYP